jgi:Holliday junction resolvase RusA-like endonuclease
MKKEKREVKQIIYGECCSKANSRRLVQFGGKPRFIKSKKALVFERDVQLQAKKIKPMLEGDLMIEADIYYSSRRPDLDESILLDALQGIWYQNDRAFKQKIIRKFLDKKNPRCEVTVTEIDWDEKKPPSSRNVEAF